MIFENSAKARMIHVNISNYETHYDKVTYVSEQNHHYLKN